MGETTLSDVIGDAVALVEAARADVSEDGGIPGAQPPSWTIATCAAWRSCWRPCWSNCWTTT
jgi:hypothetical protein